MHFSAHGLYREYGDGVAEFSLEKLRRTNIWLYRKQGLDDSMNMRIHGVRSVATMKRFNRVMRDGEIETYWNAVSQEEKGRDDGEQRARGNE